MATRGVVCSYQEVVDLSTQPDHVTVIGIHTPTGDTPRKMFRGFYDQYKKVKYLGASVSLVPAARLPADMLQIGYEGGDVIDMRDAMNPVMFHGCHGDDLGVVLNRLYGNGDAISDSLDGIDVVQGETTPGGILEDLEYDQLERLYYKALTDNTWKKAHPQRGFRKSGLHPLVYTMATNRQLMPGSTIDAMMENLGTYPTAAGGDPASPDLEGTLGSDLEIVAPTVKRTQFFTPRLTGLGWLDTRMVVTDRAEQTIDPQTIEGMTPEVLQSVTQAQINYTEFPKLYMGVILLSKLYKVAQYYRMIINHRFAFKDFRSISFMPEQSGVPSYFNANGEDASLFNPETFEDFQTGE